MELKQILYGAMTGIWLPGCQSPRDDNSPYMQTLRTLGQEDTDRIQECINKPRKSSVVRGAQNKAEMSDRDLRGHLRIICTLELEYERRGLQTWTPAFEKALERRLDATAR